MLLQQGQIPASTIKKDMCSLSGALIRQWTMNRRNTSLFDNKEGYVLFPRGDSDGTLDNEHTEYFLIR
jgi:hypothetical protein